MVIDCASAGIVICGSSGSPSEVTMLPSLFSWKRAGAGVGQLARRPADLKEAVALNHDVERVIGRREVALGEDDLVGGGARAEAKLQARRHGGLLAGGGAGLHHVLVEQVLKLRAPHLVAGGIGVGEVVGDVIDVELLGRHAAGGAVECSNHEKLLLARSSMSRRGRLPQCFGVHSCPSRRLSAAFRTGASPDQPHGRFRQRRRWSDSSLPLLHLDVGSGLRLFAASVF